MGAADRLHLSQPAMSRALGRLRQVTGDEILVRSGRTMTPTPYAVAVQERVHSLVGAASDVLTPRRTLDLRTLDRTFTIRSHDLLIGVVATDLYLAIARAAPGVRIRIIAESAGDTSELERGRVDLELGGALPTSAVIKSQVLGAGRMGVALRPDHPLEAEDLTLALYAGAEHVVVSRRGRFHDPIDVALAAAGLTRRVIATVPTSVDALRIVQKTDAVAAIPLEASRTIVADLGLHTRVMPLDVAPILAVSSWHQRYETDPAHRWLREQVRLAFAHAYEMEFSEAARDAGGSEAAINEGR